jgi:hypothetical protein
MAKKQIQVAGNGDLEEEGEQFQQFQSIAPALQISHLEPEN